MRLDPLLPFIRDDRAISDFLDHAQHPAEYPTLSLPAVRGLQAPVLALAASTPGAPLTVAVTATERDADDLLAALKAYLSDDAVDIFPAWETLPHERLSPRTDTMATRIRLQRRLAHPAEFADLRVLVMPVRALIQPIVAGLGDLTPVHIRRGDVVDRDQLAGDLQAAAYSRVDMVERRGQFAIRGGIVDVFPPTEPHPIRLELFGDDVDELRYFSLADQRSLEPVEELYAPACREILITDAVKEKALRLQASLPGAADMLEQIAAGIAPEGMESLAPAFVDLVPVASTFPPDSRIALIEPERIAQHADSLTQTTDEFMSAAWSAAASGGKLPIDVHTASFLDLADVRDEAIAHQHPWWTVSGFMQPDEVAPDAREPEKYAGNMAAALTAIGRNVQSSNTVVIAVDGAGLGKRLAQQLNDADIPTVFGDLPNELASGVCYVVRAAVTAGFVLTHPDYGQDHRGLSDQVNHTLTLLSAEDLTRRSTNRNRPAHKMPARRKQGIDPLELKPGDYVVHERHGVGRFVKMDKRALGAQKTQREYIVIEYAPSHRGGPADHVWVPTDSLDQVSRYMGGEAPTLNKMGGADWAKTKSKAREATKQIASELVRLYAKRQATPGYAFSPDTPWQRELEDAFEYSETPDQLRTIDEVKADMERPVPMDRLICGDVGYGKTEIAVRAAFKAVQDSKQVAILVPTTLLVQQHYETFTERYAGFPVRVAALSRFQSDKESAAVVKGLAAGTIDVVIGTHRLLTGSVRFKDLGLVVVDEEQRFGVEHKETLKQMYPTVDVLSMSATPIPRTLEMAVTGVRDMSLLTTPPEERHPVLTYVGRAEDKQVSAAIRREMLRDGQVFFVHNRVDSIPRVASHLQELVPEARIATAHGKMSEASLEQAVLDFWNKDVDVLVCTTIIETGLDIANANTLIVDRADRFGLSQLHQLRGRVGRGRERAYAYFLYDPERSMTETAVERLRTIATQTDLGAGMQVAMKDLEIRGAGNMLGEAQAGHLAGVGFDLYVRMVSEAVSKLRAGGTSDSEAEADDEDVKIEIPIDAFLPETYVPSERLRLEAYSKISASRTQEQRDDIRAELEDRYGPVPAQAQLLFTVAQLREMCRKAGIRELQVMGNNLRVAPVELADSRQIRLKRLYPAARLKPAIRVLLVPLPSGGRMLGDSDALTGSELVDWVSSLVNAIFIAA
ncbi:MAG: transcription-repair coupling factor [Actinomycetaceae bacterium]|nr:transcription-repair coupling factor [Actinomycetaceae bacterium]